MSDFRGRNSGPRRSYDGGNFSGGGERQSFKAVCADCGRDCDLPFEPRGNRPVYCRDCFRNHPQEDRPQRSDSRDARGPRRDFAGDRRGSDRPMFSAVCSNCGKTCQLPFEPRSNKPVFCSDCFEQKGKGQDLQPRRDNSNGKQKNTLDEINTKLDKILNLLSNGKALKAEEKRPEAAKILDEVLREAKVEKAKKISKPKKVAKKTVKEVKVAEMPIATPVEISPELPTE